MSILDGVYWENEMRKKTNADRIREMTDEELALLFWGDLCPCHLEGVVYDCPVPDEGDRPTHEDCKKCWLDWLRQEANDD